MAVSIKPEIYISWIPRGQIEIKPEIYASIILAPKQEQITADTLRKISRKENISADTFRKIGKRETVQSDTLKIIKKSETIQGDTFRQIAKSESVRADTFRRLQTTEKILGDTCRKISNIEVIQADTLREVYEPNLATEIIADTLLQNFLRKNISADTLRKIIFSETVSGDTFLKTTFSEKISADTLLKNFLPEIISADTKVVIAKAETVSADTLLKIQSDNVEIISADTCLQLREIVSADTCRQIIKTVSVAADTNIRLPHDLRYTVNSPLVNTFKDYGITSITITLNEKTLSDTFQLETARPLEINDAVKGKLLNYNFNFLVEETNRQNLIQSVRGMYDIDTLLYTTFKVSEGAIIHITNSSTKASTKPANINRSTTYYYYSASYYLGRMANIFGMTADIHIEDFIPYNINIDQNTTYESLLSSVFGWTSRVPQRQINVFIRDGILHCIQRGMEESVIDISDVPHDRPTVNKKLLRTMWNRGTYNADDDDDKDDDDDDLPIDSEEEIAQPFSGTITFSDEGVYSKLVYEDGLLMREQSKTSNDEFYNSVTIDYSYIHIETKKSFTLSELNERWRYRDTYLAEKRESTYTYQYGERMVLAGYNDKGGVTFYREYNKDKVITTTNDISYQYVSTKADGLYLREEAAYTKRITQEMTVLSRDPNSSSVGWKTTSAESEWVQTFHYPIGNGWYGQSVYKNGEPQGSNISQGAPGNKVTPYTINEVQKTFTTAVITYRDNGDKDKEKHKSLEDKYKKLREKLSPITDVSFPVRDIEMLFELTFALEWLNRKTQEEISVDIIDTIKDGIPTFNHIVDFTERVMLDGAEYFLVSNNISFTPRKLIQKLRLIRWY